MNIAKLVLNVWSLFENLIIPQIDNIKDVCVEKVKKINGVFDFWWQTYLLGLVKCFRVRGKSLKCGLDWLSGYLDYHIYSLTLPGAYKFHKKCFKLLFKEILGKCWLFPLLLLLCQIKEHDDKNKMKMAHQLLGRKARLLCHFLISLHQRDWYYAYKQEK